MRLIAALTTALALLCAFAGAGQAAARPPHTLVTVAYATPSALDRAVADGRGVVVQRIPQLQVAVVRPLAPAFAHTAEQIDGIRLVEPLIRRQSDAEPALFATTGYGLPYEWQFDVAHEGAVPASVARAAAAVTIAVIDTGADLSAPDLAAKAPRTYDLHAQTFDVRDANGHGTFVSSLAAGSVTNGEGIAGFGGDARLLVVKAGSDDGSMTDVDEANGIVYAVDHGARVINLSVGGTSTSFAERRGIQYAADHGVLVVAAVGNEHDDGNPVEYPAALLQPVGSNGRGGVGLAVGASAIDGSRSSFSNTGSQLSLVAPGEDVFGAVSSLASSDEYPRVPLPGSSAGEYGFASGTSFSAPEVAGAAALVMAANPLLRASEVADVLKASASNHGDWNENLGYGELDVAAAVARAQGGGRVVVNGTRLPGKVRVQWYSVGAATYRVSLRIDNGAPTVLFADTTRRSVTLAVRRGHRYALTVSAVDENGTATSTSTYALRG